MLKKEFIRDGTRRMVGSGRPGTATHLPLSATKGTVLQGR
jgi:hypothetical protein